MDCEVVLVFFFFNLNFYFKFAFISKVHVLSGGVVTTRSRLDKKEGKPKAESLHPERPDRNSLWKSLPGYGEGFFLECPTQTTL